MKKCSTCSTVKDDKEFGKDSCRKDGLRGQCKKCVAQYQEAHKEEKAARQRQHYEENREEMLVKHKQYREEHKEEKAATNKRWLEKNPEYSKQYREEHKEEIAASKKQYNENHKEEKAEYDKQYREENREEILACGKQYYEEHREEILINAKQYREEHKEEAAAYNKLWRKNNPDVKIVHEQNRRARKMGNGGAHTAEEWSEIKQKYDYTCLRCKRKEPEIKLTADHIIPLIKGGANSIDNIQPLCRSCNSTKHDKTIDYRNYFKERIEN